MITFLKKIFGSVSSPRSGKESTEILSDSNEITFEILTAYREGQLLFNSNKFEEALKIFDTVIKVDIFPDIFFERGFCLQRLGFLLDAIDDYSVAIKLFPNDPNNYFLRSQCKQRLGYYDEAIMDLQNAVELSKVESDINRERDQNIKKNGWNSSVQFYEMRLYYLIEESNFSETIKKIIAKPGIRRNKIN